jgi:hypothetical protein
VSTVTIGTGTSSGYNAPYNNYYKYSTNEAIYTAAEIGGAGLITAIAYNVASASSFSCTSLKIYMAHKSGSTFSSASDYVAYADMTLVYSASSKTIGASTGWETITLDTPFNYNGTDNLVIIICRQSSSYTSSLKYYYTSVTSSVLYRQNDSTAAYADASSTSYSFTASAIRPNIQLTTVAAEVPGTPTNLTRVDTGSGTDLVLQWDAQETASAYHIYKNGVLVSTQSGTTYTETVDAATAYIYAVSAYNVLGESGKAEVAVIDAPAGLQQNGEDYLSISLSWGAISNCTGYRVYKDGVLLATTTATAYTDTGVFPSETHTYSVAAYNSAGDGFAAAVIGTTIEAYFISGPVIKSVSLSANPVTVSQQFTISIIVEEETRILYPQYPYSGTVYSGQWPT